MTPTQLQYMKYISQQEREFEFDSHVVVVLKTASGLYVAQCHRVSQKER